MNFIDSHHHLWDLGRHHYPWLAEDDHDRGWGDWSDLRRNYTVVELMRDLTELESGPPSGRSGSSGTWRLLGSVHVQANIDASDPVAETRWIDSLASDPNNPRALPTGIVGWADFSDPTVEALLDAHAQVSDRMRGIRQVLNRHTDHRLNRAVYDFLADAGWRDRIGALKRYDWSFDAQVYWHQMNSLAALATQHDSITFIVDHAGMPVERDSDALANWRKGLRTLAACPNVVIKLSGYGMTDNFWTVDRLKPYVIEPIEYFGADRAMFASNFPVDRLMSSYSRLWQAYDVLTQYASSTEREALFWGTASRVYRI